MTTTYYLKNTHFKKRDYETTNVVAASHSEQFTPSIVDRIEWVPAGPGVIKGLSQLWTEGGVTFYGYQELRKTKTKPVQ